MDHSDVKLNRRLFLGGGVSTAALTVTGCGFTGDSSSGGSDNGDGNGSAGSGPSGEVRLVFGSAAIDSLDPHYVNNAMIVVPAGLLEGLVFADDDSTGVVPAAAEDWDVSEDETVYTFHMRQGATWSNGDRVTADDAEWSFQRLLTPTGAGTNYAAGASSYLTGIGILGATDYMSGATDDWDEVGVRALDEDTLEIELEAPNADFLLLMSHYSMVLVHPPSVEEDDTAWMEPENWIGNGAFAPERWEPTTQLRMVANESYWDYENVGVDAVELVLGMDGTASIASFSSDEIDVTTADPTTLDQREDLAEQWVKVDGYVCLYIQMMWGGHEAGLDQRVRRALSMAIDREAIAGTNSADAPGVSLIPGNSVPGWDEAIAIPYDVDGARTLLAEAGIDQMPDIRLQFNNDSTWMPLLAEQWEEAFGASVNVDVLEGGVHSETRWQPHEDESVISFYGGTFAGVPSLNNWTNNIFGPDYVMEFSLSTEDMLAYRDIEEDEGMDDAERAVAVEAFLREHADPDAVRFADLAMEARGTVDGYERVDKFLEAAQLREELSFTLPLTWGARNLLVADRVSGVVLRPSPEVCYYKYITVSG